MSNFDCENKKILEIGCGIGLTSLLLNKKNLNITATDYHPEVGTFLKNNTRLNNDKLIPYFRSSWIDFEKSELEKYDIIIGSDLLYERNNAEHISKFINAQVNQTAEIIIVDPKRGFESKFTTYMCDFGFSCKKINVKDFMKSNEENKGNINYYHR